MNTNTLIHNARDDIHDSEAVQSWCTTNYGRNHKVFVGINTENPPEEDQYPLVHIFPLTKDAGSGDQDHMFGVTCGIYDESNLTTEKTNVVELRGISNLEAFRKLVETVISNIALDDAHYIHGIEIIYETVEFFPYFLCAMEVHIKAELGFDDDEYQ